MPINNITQTISTIPPAGARGVDVQTIFVTKQEDFQDHLQGTTVTELNALVTQQNTMAGAMNSTATQVNTNANTATTKAGEANTSASSASTSATQALTSRNQAETFAQQAQASAESVDANNIVYRTGNQTIDDVKTFSSNPISTSTQSTAIDALTRKDYVDTKVEKVTSIDNVIVRFDGTTGKVQNSGVYIDDNGNIGLGNTPNVNTTIPTIFGDYFMAAGKVDSYILANASYQGGVYKYLTTSKPASQYVQAHGEHYWFNAPSGTAGNTITWATAMVLNASGQLLVGQPSGTSHAISGNNYDTGLPIIQFGGGGMTNAIAFFAVNQSAWSASNAAATAIRVGRSSTERSINAIGSINAYGADYAEYEYSNDITIVKGQIVGFKADGTLTDKYVEAIRFAIKSTNPAIVGGDVWGGENIVGKRPEQPVRKPDKTEQVQVEESEEFETVVIEVGDTDAEWETIETQYKADLADFEARLEAERQKVDRVAYAGKVPVNIYGATAGQYIVAIEKDGGIDGLAVNKADMTFAQYQDAVGRVNKILDDGRAEVAVIIH